MLACSHMSLQAQTSDSTYNFTIIKELPHTSVKNQYHSQTCWSFSGLSFFESEMLRKGKPAVDLSEMFIVNHCYQDKAQKFVRMKGNTNFGPGGVFYDILYVARNYGLEPEQAYHGSKQDSDLPDHTDMDLALRKKVEFIITHSSAIPPAWPDTLKKMLNTYMGEIPSQFSYKGQNYTPVTFEKDYCGINPDDYAQVTSFTHHPFYKPFILEVPDNWLWSNFYNVPLDDLEKIIDNSIESGYTVAWAADVTEKGFLTSKEGIAVIPDEKALVTSGGMAPSENKVVPLKEKKITQELRQAAFDDQETTDDHGMHIIGLAKDQFGKQFYIVKNSWGDDYNSYKGYFYASIPYVRYKTTSIMVNKNAIPKNIRKKLGI
jgi:bleomycin hydrolase